MECGLSATSKLITKWDPIVDFLICMRLLQSRSQKSFSRIFLDALVQLLASLLKKVSWNSCSVICKIYTNISVRYKKKIG